MEQDKEIEIWKIKKLIQKLEQARGNGTSMISLMLPPKSQISLVNKMLAEEFGTATNIKSRVNRLSVLSAITSTQQKLKLFKTVPENGLVIYCGTILMDDNKEKKVTIDLEPFKPINRSLYICDNRFHTEPLQYLLESSDKFGFIIMDGNGSLFGTLSGNTRQVIHKFSVDLPKKHGRGGQSALRFARLRLEKRANYLRKVAEMTTQLFISNDKINVTGLILAGSAEFKNDLMGSHLFDPRLSSKVLKIVDVSYGSENGFNQAIELSSDALSNVKFIREKKIISQFFNEISIDSGKYSFGIEDTIKCLEMGAIEILIIYENLEIFRYVLCDLDGNNVIKYLNEDKESFVNSDNEEIKMLEKSSLLEWFVEKYINFGAILEIVSDKSQEGTQFMKGFGGIGAILRYPVDLDSDNNHDE